MTNLGKVDYLALEAEINKKRSKKYV